MALTELKNTTENLPVEIEDAVKSQVEYYKLYIFRLLAKSAVGLVKIFAVGLFSLLILFFLSMAFAMALGDVLGKTYLGFFVVAVVLLLLFLLGYYLRKKLIYKSLIEKMSDIYFKED